MLRASTTRKEKAMQRSFLRFALLADAAVSGATGLLAFAGAGILDGLLGLPTELLRYAGLSLIPYAAIVAYVGTPAERVACGGVGDHRLQRAVVDRQHRAAGERLRCADCARLRVRDLPGRRWSRASPGCNMWGCGRRPSRRDLPTTVAKLCAASRAPTCGTFVSVGMQQLTAATPAAGRASRWRRRSRGACGRPASSRSR